MDKPRITTGEYVIKASALAQGGIVTGPKRLIGNTACSFPCPYCSRPEGWDACPVHRDGVPTPPPATPSQ